MNPNTTFAFIGGPRVAMQIMKLYQKREERQLFAYTNIIRERGENTHCYTLLQKKKSNHSFMHYLSGVRKMWQLIFHFLNISLIPVSLKYFKNYVKRKAMSVDF